MHLSARPREPPACGARDGQHRTSTKRDRIAIIVVAKVIRWPSMMVRSTITVGMTAVPMVVAMMAMTIANVRGTESGRRAAASMAERQEQKLDCWGSSQLWDSLAAGGVFADGHTVSNAPDLFRPPKLSGAEPG